MMTRIQRLGHHHAATALLLATAWASCLSITSAEVLLQSDSRATFGDKAFDYFFFEAEDFHTNDPRGEGPSWLLSSDEDALFVTVSEEINPETDEPFEPDPGAYASGGESITNALVQSTITNEEGGGHDIQYQLQFDTPGNYHLYIRQHSPMGPETNRNPNDSFYYPIEFGEDPVQLKANGDDYGLLESSEFPGDTLRRGPWVWFAAREEVLNEEQDPPIDQDPGTFLEYSVSDAMVGEPLIFEMDHREDGTMLDAFLFIAVDSGLPPTNGEGPDGNGFFGQGDAVDIEFGLSNLGFEPPAGIPGDFDNDSMLTASDIDALSGAIRAASNEAQFDLNGDSQVNDADRTVWVQDLKNTYIGDSNLDGLFNSSDLVAVFSVGKFEQDVDAGWADGDWTGDGRFNTGDFVAAFGDGGFEAGPRAATQAVPEPASCGLLLLGGLLALGTVQARRASK